MDVGAMLVRQNEVRGTHTNYSSDNEETQILNDLGAMVVRQN